uniref:Uncharacterized protein n=1 Tax=Moniliophthora roreri TaxID=221103 RepID=A0A0W0ETX1_MONRR
MSVFPATPFFALKPFTTWMVKHTLVRTGAVDSGCSCNLAMGAEKSILEPGGQCVYNSLCFWHFMTDTVVSCNTPPRSLNSSFIDTGT